MTATTKEESCNGSLTVFSVHMLRQYILFVF